MIWTMIAALAAQACTVPPAVVAWTETPTVVHAATASIGHRTVLKLVSAPHYALTPGKVSVANTLGGTIAFAVARAGTYRIAIGAPAWIDVVRDGKALSSSAHAHGEAYTGIAKIVDFTLSPGRYVLQLSGAKTPNTKVLIAPLP